MNDWTLIKDKAPSRQGFYLVCTEADDEDAKGVVAEWREYDKKVGKRWWIHTSDAPTIAKTPQPLEGVVRWDKASQAQIDAALKRELTREEHIEEAYQAYLRHTNLYPEYPAMPPASRRIEVGDELELGNLRRVVAVAIKEEGRVIVYSFHDVKHSYGKEIDQGTAYRAEHWMKLIPKKTRRNDVILSKDSLLTGGFSSGHLSSLLSDIVRGLDSTPDYQRDYVWTHEDQQRYLDTLMGGRDLGRFIIVDRKYPLPDQVLDGKQRLNCLNLFIRSEIAWRGVYWHELSQRDRNRLDDRVVQIARVDEDRYTRADLLRIFLEVNAGGVPQSDEHLNHVRELLAAEEANEAKTAQAA